MCKIPLKIELSKIRKNKTKLLRGFLFVAFNRLEVCYLYPMICFPNGKINLGLNVLSKREDGFHNIETIIYPVPIRDALEFLPANSFQFVVSGINIDGQKEDNLIYKAWELLNTNFKLPSLRIHLHKAIPLGSGLGGGSSDAAFFMQAVNDYFHLGIGREEMKILTGQLGSDCPFFVENFPIMATGKGEILQPLSISLSGYYLLVIKPGIHVSSSKAYSMVQARKPETNLLEIISKPLEQWKGQLKNDFENPIFNVHPEIKEIKNNLYKLGAVYASMSGSGSAVYGIFTNRPVLKYVNPNNYLWFGKL